MQYMLKRSIVSIIFTLSFITVSAQKATVKGAIIDLAEKKQLQHGAVLLIRSADSVLIKNARTGTNGEFLIDHIPGGDYRLIVTYPKMADYITNLRLADTSQVNLGTINMELKSNVLNEVVIRSAKNAVRMQGDTLVFQADSFIVKANANVQELLKRLPGIVVDKNGLIKAQGKEVRTVLVDGDEFFGDDPLLATKYLKANAVEEVQVYDRKSKTAELSGIDDGIKNKTINIKLKENAKNGYLTAVDGNYGTNNSKDYGAMLGVFKNKLKAAVFATYSNLANESKINRSMRKLKGEDYDVIEVGDDGSSMMYSSGGDDDDDYGSPTGGLPENVNLGAHFAEKLDPKMGIKLNFKSFNYRSTNRKTSNSQELLPGGTLFTSSGKNDDYSKSTGESIMGTYSYAIDSLSALKVSFGARQSRNYLDTKGQDETKNENGVLISQNGQINTGQGNASVFNGNINWSRKFNKKGRTLSIDIQPESLAGDNRENSINRTLYFNDNGIPNRIDSIDLNKDNVNRQNSLGARFNYTEPLSKHWALEAGYSFKTIASSSYRFVNNKGGQKIDSLSNNFKFINFSNVGKFVIQYKIQNFSISSGLEATQTNFELRDLDRSKNFNRNYLNLSPATNIFYKVNNNSSLSANYNGYMQQPNINQLQPVNQLDNPLYQIVGNTDLRPSFTNNFSLSFNSFQFKTDEYISAYLSYGFTNNAITETEIVDDFNKRVSSFTNLNGINSTAGNIYYSKGFSGISMRLGIDLGFNTSNNITVINFTKNKTRNNQYNLRTTFNYYTPKIDISYAPSANLMSGRSSIGDLNDGRSLVHDHEFSATVQMPYKIEFNTTLSLSFRPANLSFERDLNIAILNSYVSTKLLKNEALEIRLTATDLLNQKIGYSRFVGGNIKSENTFSYIPRYLLIGINWNLSGNFIKNPTSK
jgi:hypothetical protein